MTWSGWVAMRMPAGSTDHREMNRLTAIIKGCLNPYSLGLGLLWAWVYCAYRTPALFGATSGFSIGADSSWFMATLAVTVSLVVLGIVLRRRNLSSMRMASVAAGLLVALGSVACDVAVHLPVEFARVCRIAGGVAIGVGYAWLCIAWGGVLARCDIERVEAAVPAASVVMLVCPLVFPLLKGVAGTIGAALLPIVSAGLLLRASSARSQCLRTILDEGSSSNSNPEGRARFVVPVACSFVVLGTTYFATVCTPGLVSVSPSDSRLPYDLAFLIGSLTGVCLALGVTYFSVRIDFRSIFRWVAPMVIVAVALSAYSGLFPTFLALLLIACVDTCAQAVAYVYFVKLGCRGDVSVTLGIGLGQGAVQLGTLLGNIAVSNLVTVNDVSGFRLTLCALVAVATVFVPCIDSPFERRDQRGPVPAPTDAVVKNVACIADRYGLSPREREVVELLAQGRSQPYIRDCLVLSKSTVATHVRHIYAKLGIHTRQELIDLVNEPR